MQCGNQNPYGLFSLVNIILFNNRSEYSITSLYDHSDCEMQQRHHNKFSKYIFQKQKSSYHILI